ncbi:MAG: hypothetical protein KBE65_13210 [Phycisphaerae bacterium]|nr:hypothetical protein [Phycisphaerae bacterium]
MRKLLFIGVLCAVVASPALADLTLQIGYSGSNYGPYQTGLGGEFTVNPSGWDPLPYYADDKDLKDVGVDGTFQTFCLERLETISAYPSEYAVVLSDSAVYGGVGGADPLSIGTAWLYKQFQDGTLDYAYDGTTAERKYDADLLQKAIWWLEGEKDGAENKYTALAISQFGSAANAKADNDGAYAVRVMNLWDKNYVGVLGHQHQDLLVCVPVPGAVLLGLLGLGYAGRRLRKMA